MKKNSKKTPDAIVKFDNSKPIWIYEVVDPDTRQAFYAGQTTDLKRRGNQHAKSKYKINELLKLKNVRFKDVVRIVPELPHGCHADDADELEAWVIFNRKTVYDPIDNPMGCNSRIGNFGTNMTPERYAELKETFETTGYQWPIQKCYAPEDVPDDLAKARGTEKVIEIFLEDARTDGDVELVDILEAHSTLAKYERFAIEKTFYGVRDFAEIVLKSYKNTYVDAVDLTNLFTQLEGIKEKLKDDPEFEDLAGVITAFSLVAHPDKKRIVSSTAAVAGLEMILAMISTREEEQLTWTHETAKTRIFELRAWTRANSIKKPMKTSTDAFEASLGTFLRDWKSPNRNYGGAFTDLKSARVVMRDVVWFDNFVGSVGRNKDEWKTLNSQLLDGFAWHTEPEFEGKKMISIGNGNKSVYKKLRDLVNRGAGSPANFDIALAGLPKARETWYRSKIAANREKTLANLKVSRDAAKKRKLDAGAGSSTNPLENNDDDDDDEEEDEDDEDEEGGE